MEVQDPVGLVMIYLLMGSLTAVVTVICLGGCALFIKAFWKELRK